MTIYNGPPLDFETFQRLWWKENIPLAHSELGSNGQFDELPFLVWGDILEAIGEDRGGY